MDFVKYQHIERIGTEEVEGLLIGKCYVFYKIDGTNGQVYLNQDGAVECGSRKQILNAENTNQGFWNHVQETPAYAEYLAKYPTHKLFGEWLVPHSLKTYRETAWRNFYVFDVVTVDDQNGGQYLTYEEYSVLLDKFGIKYIPPICTMENPTVDRLVALLDKTGEFLVKDGCGLGEGIVIKNYQYRNQFGRQIWGKIVRTEFKEAHVKEMGVPNLLVEPEIEKKIVDKYITSALVEKELNKIKTDAGHWESKYIPRLLETVFYCLMTEEAYNFVKEFKMPTIDSKRLKNYCILRTKELATNVF